MLYSKLKKVAHKKLMLLSREDLLHILLDPFSFPSFSWLRKHFWMGYIRSLSSKDLFTLIYKKNLWGNLESISGPGSTLVDTEELREALPEILRKLGAKTLLDIPCGDFNWMKYVDLVDIQYIGADIVPELIQGIGKQYSNDRRKFLCLDLVTDNLPKSDVILCRDCLVHLTNSKVNMALSNICKSGSTYLLATTFPEKAENKEVEIDFWRPVNLEKEPFNLPSPLLLINENNHIPGYQDKSLGLWRISDIIK